MLLEHAICKFKSWMKKRFQSQDADLRILAYKIDNLEEKLNYIIMELENK